LRYCIKTLSTLISFLSLGITCVLYSRYNYRTFFDKDNQVIPLLTHVRRVAPSFADQLLDEAGAPATKQELMAQSLVEPLSERELEVLRLIAAGLSNREIAQELFIAVGTVKRHTNHIYGKLGVHSRTEAVVRARELGLL
jgi:LuxR family maltose regulon positive regulatory protein